MSDTPCIQRSRYKSKVKEVRFCTLPPLLPEQIKQEELRLGGFLNSGMNQDVPVSVTYSGSAFIECLCASDERHAGIDEFV